MELTQAYIKSAMHYDPLTGIFTRGGKPAGGVSGNRKYHHIHIGGKKHRAHRLVFLYMEGSFPDACVDHINRNKLDNRYANLRKVSHTENQHNSNPNVDNKSGVIGVCWHKNCKRWQATIKLNNRVIYLGIFLDWFDAVCARKSAQNLYGYHPNHGMRPEICKGQTE